MSKSTRQSLDSPTEFSLLRTALALKFHFLTIKFGFLRLALAFVQNLTPSVGLAQILVPEATRTHRPVPHHEIVEALVETLSFRHIGVVNEEYAVSPDGMKMFGVLDLETQIEGCRFSIGIRNSHDKSLRLGLTAGLRVFVCSNMAFSGDFTPVTMLH